MNCMFCDSRVINTYILRSGAEDAAAADAISASTGDNRMPGTDRPPAIGATRFAKIKRDLGSVGGKPQKNYEALMAILV